jgi:K+-sensing histidine kinase KdpD
VLAHLVVNLLHGRAHEELGVSLSTWQYIYVINVILFAPLIAMLLLWTRYARMVSMAGSLIFGVSYHYLIISPDHIFHLPPGDAAGTFRLTAFLLVLTELFGVIVGLFGLRSNTRVYS